MTKARTVTVHTLLGTALSPPSTLYAGDVDRVTGRQLRALRGIVASATTVLLAAAAHTFAGGGAPAPLLVIAATMLAAPVAMMLVGKRPSIMRTAAAVLGAQVVFHGVFALFGSGPTVAFTAPVGAHAHMARQMVAMPAHAMAHDSMPVAHLVAALATVLVLHSGERMLRAIGRGLRRLVPLRTTRTPRPVLARPVRATFTAPVLRTAILVCPVGRRGPPGIA